MNTLREVGPEEEGEDEDDEERGGLKVGRGEGDVSPFITLFSRCLT